MSDPWIRVYPGDMRGDPAILEMNCDMRYALIQAWDLAKNGPGAMAELRSSGGRAMSERELRALANVSGSATRRMFERWASSGLCTLSDDGLVTFPNLAKRQGIDPTAAERKRRERERRRHGHVTPMSRSEVTAKSRSMSRHVTGESLEPESREPTPTPPAVTSRKPDPIWDALLDACPVAGEMTKSERGRRNAAAKELREIGAAPAAITTVARHLAQKWGGRVAVTPSAIVSNWAATVAEINPNGLRPKPTPEDFDRIAAEREAAAEEQRKAALAGAIASQPDEEDVPF